MILTSLNLRLYDVVVHRVSILFHVDPRFKTRATQVSHVGVADLTATNTLLVFEWIH